MGSAAMMLSLAGCGADDVASPGEGTIVTPPPTSTSSGGTTTPPPSGSTGGGAASACPSGTIDRNTITNSTSNTTWRNCEISGRITADTTIQKLPGVIYSLSGPVNVGTDVGGDGNAAGGQRVTLTVQPGVVIFASAGNDYLIVNRGSRINAVGTANSPIIFTARQNVEGSATDSSQGLWGGVILLGRAPISNCQTAGTAGGSAGCQQIVEGTTSSLYGGNVPTDNSGTMQYVQIRYSGFSIAPGNELQGLTTGGVGSATTLDHIQIHNSSDDGVEFFGGRQNAKYLVFTGTDDDAIDTDLGYRGTIQFVIAVQRDASNGDSMIEADSADGAEEATPRQYTRVSNATFVQRSTAQGLNAILLRGGTDYALLNSIVVGPSSCIDIDNGGGSDPTPYTTRDADASKQEMGPPVFRSVVLSCTTAPFRADGNEAIVATIFGTGTNNNNSTYTSTLTNVFVNGANETAVAATDPTTFNADMIGGENTSAPNRLTAVSYIGAVRNSTDTWYAPWACSPGYVSFGTAACTAIPTN